MTRGPIITARVLSLTGAVASDTRCPPTPVGTQRDHASDGLRGTFLLEHVLGAEPLTLRLNMLSFADQSGAGPVGARGGVAFRFGVQAPLRGFRA